MSSSPNNVVFMPPKVTIRRAFDTTELILTCAPEANLVNLEDGGGGGQMSTLAELE